MKTVRKVAERAIMLYPFAKLHPLEAQILFDGTPAALTHHSDPRVAQFASGGGPS
jgi:phospholipid/cholesterol/gamma-HCH transport system ATP-binding protein